MLCAWYLLMSMKRTTKIVHISFQDKYDWKKISQDFRLKSLDETKTYFIEQLNQSDFVSTKHKKRNFEFYLTIIYLSFCYHWLCFNIWFLIIDWYFHRHCKFGSRIKNMCNIYKIERYRSIVKKKKK